MVSLRRKKFVGVEFVVEDGLLRPERHDSRPGRTRATREAAGNINKIRSAGVLCGRGGAHRNSDQTDRPVSRRGQCDGDVRDAASFVLDRVQSESQVTKQAVRRTDHQAGSQLKSIVLSFLILTGMTRATVFLKLR